MLPFCILQVFKGICLNRLNVKVNNNDDMHPIHIFFFLMQELSNGTTGIVYSGSVPGNYGKKSKEQISRILQNIRDKIQFLPSEEKRIFGRELSLRRGPSRSAVEIPVVSPVSKRTIEQAGDVSRNHGTEVIEEPEESDFLSISITEDGNESENWESSFSFDGDDDYSRIHQYDSDELY